MQPLSQIAFSQRSAGERLWFICQLICYNSLLPLQVHIGVKGEVRDAVTDHPLPNTVIHVRNVTGGQETDIRHDITSGTTLVVRRRGWVPC